MKFSQDTKEDIMKRFEDTCQASEDNKKDLEKKLTTIQTDAPKENSNNLATLKSKLLESATKEGHKHTKAFSEKLGGGSLPHDVLTKELQRLLQAAKDDFAKNNEGYEECLDDEELEKLLKKPFGSIELRNKERLQAS